MVPLHPQYITDTTGAKLSVILPIQEYAAVMQELEALEILRHEEPNAPDWHTQLVSERLESYRRNPSQAADFESSIDEIEAGL